MVVSALRVCGSEMAATGPLAPHSLAAPVQCGKLAKPQAHLPQRESQQNRGALSLALRGRAPLNGTRGERNAVKAAAQAVGCGSYPLCVSGLSQTERESLAAALCKRGVGPKRHAPGASHLSLYVSGGKP